MNAKTKVIAALNTVNQALREQLKWGAAEAPKYVNHVKEEIIYKKAAEANAWYTRILGLDEVKFYQQRVITLQEKLLDVQEKRREIGRQLSEVRRKSNELQEQIHKVKRQEDLQRFLDLMKEETEILKQELSVTDTFNGCDREEREIFTAFTNAVKDSHEKQRAQLEYTKYFGLILSLVGSFLTFAYSTLRKQDLKRFIDERLRVDNGDLSASVLQLQLQEGLKEMRNVSGVIDRDKQLLTLISNNQRELLNRLDNSTLLNVINQNHRETAMVLQAIVHSKAVTSTEPSDSQIILGVGGIAALLGFILLKCVFG
ncbi:hypothetical protein PPYR_12779 [Photinus pyralis]|uniref:Coiled-coil domain-containing protein 51 n=1 Tax=Photinus pyralis TaxID=7054 RepID=A0A1Y1MY33_PHOPY|nr:uncharacterized protein LOC116161518 [Photinus pyralis]XP_031353994.1 uncharacterized protein LOC116178588 [Photinus pyralis]KAB0791204.1 hypothetical protein PPYR_03004 [Photinus pyralis]KAB0793159.1 hypothetical protein PPYR_12779 [Photinus pyralis]